MNKIKISYFIFYLTHDKFLVLSLLTLLEKNLRAAILYIYMYVFFFHNLIAIHALIEVAFDRIGCLFFLLKDRIGCLCFT